MTIIIGTALFALALDGVLVGAAFAVVSRKWRLSRSPLRDFGVLLVFCAILDLLWIPAVSELGISISFENPAVYTLLGLENPVSGEDLFGPSLLDVFFWLFQALLARAVAARILRDDWAAV